MPFVHLTPHRRGDRPTAERESKAIRCAKWELPTCGTSRLNASEHDAVRVCSIRRGRYGSLPSHIDRLVTFGQGLIEPGQDELVLDPIGQPFGGDHVGKIGQRYVDTSNSDDIRTYGKVVVSPTGGFNDVVGDVVRDEALGDVATDHHVAHAVTVEDRDEGRNVGNSGVSVGPDVSFTWKGAGGCVPWLSASRRRTLAWRRYGHGGLVGPSGRRWL
jgi:hypothetical protein